MTLASIALPPAPAERIPADIASRQCPAMSSSKRWSTCRNGAMAQCASEDRVLASGFHSPLEQQVLRSLLRRKDRVIKVLARYLPPDRVYRSTGEAYEPLAQGRRLILNASPVTETRTTRASALAHNRLVLALASDHCLHHTSGAVSCQKGKMSSV